jgi:hypothetical protein
VSDATLDTGKPQSGDVTAEDLQKLLEDTRKQVEHITQERDSLRDRAQNVERERDEFATRHLSEKERAYRSDLQAVEGHISSAEADLARAKQLYKSAREAGSVEDEVAAQEQIADATARRREATNRQQYLKANEKAFLAPEVRATASTDPYEELGIRGLMPGERAFADARPRFRTDPAYRDRVTKAAAWAATEFARDSQGYFDRIEELLGEKKAPETGDSTPRAQRQSVDVAPQRRQPGQQSSQNEVRLTADEVEVADAMYGKTIPDQAERYRHYATQKQKLRESGRL